jgi:hypothetical protein
MVTGELGFSFLKEHSKSLSYHPSSLLACRGFKAALGQAARGIQRAVHGIEQRQIAQLETTVKVALRKYCSAQHHNFRLTSGLRFQNFLDFMRKWLAAK